MLPNTCRTTLTSVPGKGPSVPRAASICPAAHSICPRASSMCPGASSFNVPLRHRQCAPGASSACPWGNLNVPLKSHFTKLADEESLYGKDWEPVLQTFELPRGDLGRCGFRGEGLRRNVMGPWKDLKRARRRWPEAPHPRPLSHLPPAQPRERGEIQDKENKRWDRLFHSSPLSRRGAGGRWERGRG
jgi:hypothetical protein